MVRLVCQRWHVLLILAGNRLVENVALACGEWIEWHVDARADALTAASILIHGLLKAIFSSTRP
jgi:hypothetical protein